MYALPTPHVFTIQYLSAPPLPLQTLPSRYVYAGFLHLLACFEFIGHAVVVLPYNPSKNPIKACSMGRHHILTPLNGFYTLRHLRLSLLEHDLAFHFQVSQPTVARIFVACNNL